MASEFNSVPAPPRRRWWISSRMKKAGLIRLCQGKPRQRYRHGDADIAEHGRIDHRHLLHFNFSRSAYRDLSVPNPVRCDFRQGGNQPHIGFALSDSFAVPHLVRLGTVSVGMQGASFSIMSALFSPNGEVQSRIISEIVKAKSNIDIAIYSFTSDAIRDALISARSRSDCCDLSPNSSAVCRARS